jgi:putative membrane protein
MKHKITKKTLVRIAVVTAIIIIPLLYSYLYLGAFWDPYSRLESLPVAVVNNDAGAVINDEDRNVGQEMCDELSDAADLKFIFTDEATALKGTEGDDYYAMVVIPEDFSADIASAQATDKHTANITFSANEKRNYLASQILSRAVLEIEESVRDKVNSEIVAELADTIKEVPDQMTELQDGLAKLQDGSEQLSDGTADLADGTQTYSDKMNEYQEGITQLQDGAGKLIEGTADLAEGTRTFSDKMNEYQSGVDSLKQGSDTLAAGTTSLDSGISSLLDGADKLAASTENIDQLTTGAQSLATGAQELNAGLTQYTAGVDALISSVNSTSTFLSQYVTKVNPSIMKDPVFAAFIQKLSDPANAQSIAALQTASGQLKTASAQIADGAAQLSKGCENLPQLKAALATLSAGLSQAKTGSADLAEGAKALSDGIGTVTAATSQLSDAAGDIAEGAAAANDGTIKLNAGISTVSDATTQLSDAATDIAEGAAAVNDGTTELSDGINTAKSGVDTAITDTNDQLEALDGISEYAEAPVTIENKAVTAVPNYGTAFAPYFMDTEGKFKILTATSEHKLARSFIYLLIGFAQALALAWILEYSLGLTVNNPVMYYASCCLVSMVFISIVQFLMVHLKDLGKFLSIVFLILQLTSCGGTFPMETVPKLFNVLYPYMPMTYSVGLFKEAICGTMGSDAIKNIAILVSILVVFMALTILLSGIKAKKAIKVMRAETAEV